MRVSRRFVVHKQQTKAREAVTRKRAEQPLGGEDNEKEVV
jgi:hypothetical protein